jgi:hypothetical protein
LRRIAEIADASESEAHEDTPEGEFGTQPPAPDEPVTRRGLISEAGMADTYDAKANGIGCYAEAIAAKRAKLLHERCPAAKRVVVIGNCELYQGDALTIVKHIGSVDHAIFDPPYEQSLHDSKNSLRGPARVDFWTRSEGVGFCWNR